MGLSYSQLEGAWVAGGGSPATAPIMAAIAMAESGGNPQSHNGNAGTGDNSYGLWQINMLGSMGPARRAQYGLSDNNALFDPTTNARVAVAMSNNGKNLQPWTTYTSGAYLRYMQNGVAPSGAPAGAGAAAGGVSLAADSAPAAETCLVKIPSVSFGVGSTPDICMFTKTEARALIGGVLVAAAALIGLVGMVTLIKGFDAVSPTLSGVGAAPGRIPTPSPSLPKANVTGKSKGTATGSGTSSGTVTPEEMNNEYPTKRGTLGARPRTKPKPKRVGGKRALEAAVVA